MYSIESNIPIPESKFAGRTPKDTWGSMKVGDSFAVSPQPGECLKIVRSRLSALVANATCGKFSTRTMENCVRVWRVA